MATITKIKYHESEFNRLKNIKHGRNWPVVYMLENKREVYIGETTNAYIRFKQHNENAIRRTLDAAYVIADDEYNKSATLDTESLLIQYMAADGVYQLQNGNGGLANHNYFQRENYRKKFDSLWKQLQDLKLVKHDLVQLQNSDLFKYSPYKALTDEQLLLVDNIIETIRTSSSQSFIINGEPGTGKTIVGVFLMKYLQEIPDLNLKVALVVPVTALRKTLKRVFANVKGLSPNMVIGPNEVVGKNYDLLVVDEAHRLKRRVNLTNYVTHDISNKTLGLGNEGTQFDWIMRSSKYQIFLYDENQSVMPTDIRPQQVKSIHAKSYSLSIQMRVEGGEDYIKFVNDFLALKAQYAFETDQYKFVICDTIDQLKTSILAREKEAGLSRLVAGYAWKWQTKGNNPAAQFDIEIEDTKLKWNSVNIDWVNSKNAINEVGCIHTIQGYDLNYVGVIIGPELKYDPIKKLLNVDKSKYVDFNGKRSITDPTDLDNYIRNIYKTLLTRGIKGTYVYAVDPDLRAYMSTLNQKTT
ncbi:MAG: DUF2075 domain-containing protein [Patescibacteria group bacterium]|nr:DUF2075 domain-containing protein [Patescibacteria group bacterium]